MFVRIEVVDCFIQKPSSIVTSVFFITNRPLYAQIILDEYIALLASTEIWAGLGEHLSAIETKLCAPCKGRNQMQEFGLYLADASSSDKTSLRYNVSNFLNSATTRTLPLESASP